MDLTGRAGPGSKPRLWAVVADLGHGGADGQRSEPGLAANGVQGNRQRQGQAYHGPQGVASGTLSPGLKRHSTKAVRQTVAASWKAATPVSGRWSRCKDGPRQHRRDDDADQYPPVQSR